MADTFPGIIAFAFVSVMLLIGTILRARVRFLQAGLMPASMIGGIIGFILISTGFSLGFTARDFVPFTFHFFTLSFMSLCLTGSGKKVAGSPAIFKGGMWLTLMWTMSLAMQALLGLIVIIAYNAASGATISEYLGLLVTHGFTQGPGQALTFGTIWQESYGIENAATIGLIYASFGFIVAFIFGVPIARWAINRGLNVNKNARIDEEFLQGFYKEETHLSAGRQITHAANIDTLAHHITILGIAYIATYYWLGMMQGVIGDAQPLGIKIGVLFSYNLFFLHGLIVCILLRWIIDKLGLGHFIDDDTQKRITGTAVDFMVVSTIMSITLTVLMAFLVPVLLTSVAAAIGTAAICFGFGRKLGNLGMERALTSFGCCCGSTGSGLLLLRILDPDFSTPVGKELAFFNVAILFTTLHIIMIMAPVLPNFGIGFITLVYLATIAVAGIAVFALGLWRRGASYKTQEPL